MYNCTFYGILISDYCVTKNSVVMLMALLTDLNICGTRLKMKLWKYVSLKTRSGSTRCTWTECKERSRETCNIEWQRFERKLTKSKYLRRADIEIGRPEEKMWLTTGDPGCWLKRTSLSGNFFVFPLLYDSHSNFVIIIICLLIFFLLKMTPATDSSAEVCLALF